MSRGGSSRGFSRAIGTLIVLASFATAAYLWLQYATSSQKQRIAYLGDLASRLQSETVPVKFMVLAREGGEIKARLKIYDLSGREIAVMERSWTGSELYVDMLLLPVRSGSRAGPDKADSWIALPYRVFTDKIAAASGTLLFDAYDDGGFPGVLDGVSWSVSERAEISAAFAAARKSAAAGLPATGAAKGAYGSAAHEVSKLSRFELGIVYEVVCRIKGGVEIMEE